MSTKIDWCDEVWNPVTGCTKGCPYCYARRFAERMQHHPNEKIAHQYRNGFAPTFHPDRLDIPSKWKKPRRVFVNSMGDLFDPQFTFATADKIMTTVSLSARHTFMVLTKQPERMKEYFDWIYTPPFIFPIQNLWLGVSVTCQAEAERYIPLLLQIPAALRFVSIEPMLGPVDLAPWVKDLDWVICGGMTGPKAVKLNGLLVALLMDQCNRTGVPFFFKGWGGARIPAVVKQALINGHECKEFPA